MRSLLNGDRSPSLLAESILTEGVRAIFQAALQHGGLTPQRSAEISKLLTNSTDLAPPCQTKIEE